MDGMDFRNFQEEDLDWVLEAIVEGQMATLSPERSATSDRMSMKAAARDDLDRFHFHAQKPELASLAWQDGRRIGFVWVTTSMPFRDEEHKAWLLEVYVIPELRRKGLGRALLAHAEEWAREQGAEEMWLNVGGGNRTALGLYESSGFRIETMHLCKKL